MLIHDKLTLSENTNYDLRCGEYMCECQPAYIMMARTGRASPCVALCPLYHLEKSSWDRAMMALISLRLSMYVLLYV